MSKKNTTPPELGAAERALYELAEKGPLPLTHGILYRPQVQKLVAVGLLEKTPRGYAAVPADLPPAEPPPEPKIGITVRLAPTVIAALDADAEAQHTTRTAIIEAILGKAYGAAQSRPSSPPQRKASETRLRATSADDAHQAPRPRRKTGTDK